MAIDAFETYTCDVCKRNQGFEKGYVSGKEKWRAISCSGVYIDRGASYGTFSVPFDPDDPHLIKYLVCDSDRCLEAALEGVVVQLRLMFDEENRKFEQS